MNTAEESVAPSSEIAAPMGWQRETEEVLVPTSFGDVSVLIGGKEQGATIVFWPSLLLDASMWSHQFEHYARDYRIALINPPGIGNSEPLRRPITVEESAECMAEILDGLKIEKCILIGSSWGSLVAEVFAARHPERLMAAVITNGTASPPTPEINTQMTELVENLEKFTTAPDWLLPATQQAFAGSTAESSKPEFMSYLGRVLNEDPLSIAFAMRGSFLDERISIRSRG